MSTIDQLPADVLGERLRQARESAKFTQAEAANQLGIARTTLVAIEKGERRVRSDELVKLAEIYKDSASRILRPNQAPRGLVLQYRKIFQDTSSDDDSSRETSKIFEELLDYSIEVEAMLQFSAPGVIPSEKPIHRAYIDAQSEDMAQYVRSLLGLGVSGHFTNLIRSLESEFKLHIFMYPLPSMVSGAFTFDSSLGGYIILNRKHAFVRQLRTLCHEVGHFLTCQNHADIVRYDDKFDNSIEERFANKFADSFLMPAAELRRQFINISDLKGKFTPRDLGELAEDLRVSIESLCHRLEDMRLLPAATFDTHIKPHESKIRSKMSDSLAAISLGKTRFERQVGEALLRGLLSEGRAAEMLAMDRADIRKMLGDLEDIDNASLL